ncbi:MAG: hypothetical protein LBC62_10820 [Treponema sp.]|jgi:hypothetical protein|nr:hypothetical protein [Treponema sp.]
MFEQQIRAAFRAAAIGMFLLFCSCGEMDSIFPINQTYQVSALAGERSLNDNALLVRTGEIKPFFVHSIEGDPDVAGLRILLQTDGEPAAREAAFYTSGFAKPEDDKEDETPEGAVSLERMDQDLPPFTLPQDLEPGAYMMVFQVLGRDRQLLAKTEKPVYYLADLDYRIDGINAYLPGASSGSHLIPPGTVVLLEALIEADEGLDPYIVWYNGRNRIGTGKLSDGLGQILWKVPAQTGFQNLMAEVVPFPPVSGRDSPVAAARAPRVLGGKVRELSLPVSAKGEAQGPAGSVEKEDGKISALYRLSGNLQDSYARSPENELIPWDFENEISGKAPRWLPGDSIYGLAVGPEDTYSVPLAAMQQGPGRLGSFSFRFKPLRDGVLFRADFVTIENSSTGPVLELILETGALVLSVTAGEQQERISMDLPLGAEFITLLLNITIRDDSFSAALGQDEKTLALDHPLTGEGIYRFGRKAAVSPDAEPGEEAQPGPAAILDEFAVTFSSETPPAPPEGKGGDSDTAHS